MATPSAYWPTITGDESFASATSAPHWHADLHVHLAAAASNCLTVEYFLLEEDIYNFEALLSDRLQPRGGRITLPQRPGLGLELDLEAVGRFTLS